MNEKKFLSVKYDEIFRLFFADERNEEFMVSFLKSVLKLPEDDYKVIEISDPHLLPEFEDDKSAIIDVKLRTKSKKIIQIEIQLRVTSELRERIVYYSSKLITEQIGKGEKYKIIKQAISIVITDEPLIKNSERYHHRFTLYDAEARVEFSDVLEIHTLELPKLPPNADGTPLYDWAKFIAAESDEEMDEIAERNQEVKKAVVKYRELTADERVRALHERREKARWEMTARENDAREDERKTMARKMLLKNEPMEKIIEYSELTEEQIREIEKTL